MCDRKFPGKAPGLLLKKILESNKKKLIWVWFTNIYLYFYKPCGGIGSMLGMSSTANTECFHCIIFAT